MRIKKYHAKWNYFKLHQQFTVLTSEYLIFQLHCLHFYHFSHLLICFYVHFWWFLNFTALNESQKKKKNTFPLNERQSINITLTCLLLRYFRFSRLYTWKRKQKELLQTFNYPPPDIYKYKLTWMYKKWNAKRNISSLAIANKVFDIYDAGMGNHFRRLALALKHIQNILPEQHMSWVQQ